MATSISTITKKAASIGNLTSPAATISTLADPNAAAAAWVSQSADVISWEISAGRSAGKSACGVRVPIGACSYWYSD